MASVEDRHAGLRFLSILFISINKVLITSFFLKIFMNKYTHMSEIIYK